jgi:3-deoxy-manno-octulosonate cytidylyltransferase (CMP-KDO synthetase)
MEHQQPKILGVIPARYASTRFMGKPLVDIGGKSMIQRVVEQALKAQTLHKVVVATDDERIFAHVKSLGYAVVMTDAAHQSGTDRIAEVAEIFQTESYHAVVNIQGDEPFIQPEQIDLLTNTLFEKNANIVTLGKKIMAEEMLDNPNVVKVVFDAQGQALYFSRHAIPFLRNVIAPQNRCEQTDFYKHIGLYAFRTDVLLQLAKLPQSRLELAESLEQLRWLEHGWRIQVGITTLETIGIDTPEDLLKIMNYEL